MLIIRRHVVLAKTSAAQKRAAEQATESGGIPFDIDPFRYPIA